MSATNVRLGGMGGGLFWSKGVFETFERSEGLSDEARLTIGPAIEVGARILGASSIEDFEEKLDSAAVDPSLGWVMAGVFRGVDDLKHSEAESGDSEPFLVKALGDGQRDLAAKADGLMAFLGAMNARLTQRLASLGLQAPAAYATTALETGEFSPAAFVYDASIPPEVRIAGLAGFRTNVLIFAALALRFGGHSAEPWLRRAIGEHLVRSAQRSLALLAAMTQAEVPDEMLPASDRLDLEAIEARNDQATEAFEQLRRQADASGVDVYPTTDLDD